MFRFKRVGALPACHYRYYTTYGVLAFMHGSLVNTDFDYFAEEPNDKIPVTIVKPFQR